MTTIAVAAVLLLALVCLALMGLVLVLVNALAPLRRARPPVAHADGLALVEQHPDIWRKT